MKKDNISVTVKIDSIKVVKDEQKVIVLDKLLAALELDELSIVKLNKSQAT